MVVGKILSIVPHQDSDHLVYLSSGYRRIRTNSNCNRSQQFNSRRFGACRTEQFHFARRHKNQKGKLRGVESNGMLCSLGELGLTLNDFPYAIEDGIFSFCKKIVNRDNQFVKQSVLMILR